MAAERPRRRITQPCLEYNGGLLHKEEIMLRRAMYASLNESKKPSPSKLPYHHLPVTASRETLQTADSSQVYTDIAESKGQVSSSEQFIPPDELDNANCGSECGKSFNTNHSALKAHPEIKKRMKMPKEPSKLLNYVIKKKKEKKKRNGSRALLRTLSPTKISGSGETSFPVSVNGKLKKKRKKRQRGALAVFVAMNKSVGGKINKNHFSEPEKDLLKSKKRRRRKRKALKNEGCDRTESAGVEDEESPIKKSKKDDKKPVRMVQAQRKFAKSHPLSPSSLRIPEERHLLSTSVTRAKTEDFLTFLCLRNHPVLPKELEIFNHPCMPTSPLSDDHEDTSTPPSPTQSQSSMSNVSNPSSTIAKSFSDSPAPSVDSPATGEGPCWESGVVRMYADGPKGLAAKSKDQKKYDELQPSDEADDPRELTKSITPPLAFRVSCRPTNWSTCRAKDKQLPRPIPKPFAVKPSLAGTTVNRGAFSPAGTSNSGSNTIPPPPPLLHPMESGSCSPPPPPLLYIPAAAQRVTHLHGPPTLQRFPSTSPTREQESGELAEQLRLSVDRNAGPPPLKRFPPVVIEHESAKKDENTDEGSSSDELLSSGESGFRSFSSRSPSKIESEVVSSASASKAAFAGSCRSSSSLSDLSKFSQPETEDEETTSLRPSKEMPLLRRHSSAGQDALCFKELVELRERSRIITSRNSPPVLQRVSISADRNQLEPCFRLPKTSAGLSNTSGDRSETSGSGLESVGLIQTSDMQREKGGDRVETSSLGLESRGSQFETFSRESETSAGALRSSEGRYETSGSVLQASGGRLETSGSLCDTSYGGLSPNFPLGPARLVKHAASGLGHSAGESGQLRASPLAISTHRNSPQAFQQTNKPRAIPIAEARLSGMMLSPGLLSARERYKSTYVFSNRQTNFPPGKEPGLLQVSSLTTPRKDGAYMPPNLGEFSSMHFQSSRDCSRADESRSVVGNTQQHSVPNQYTNHQSSSSFVSRSLQSSSEPNRQFGNLSSCRRIPSPRSDLFSRVPYEPVNSSFMSRTGVASPSPLSGEGQSVAFQSTIRHKETSVGSFPPIWSHLESPYSVPSIASRNSSPKPYTFSINLPDRSLSMGHSGSRSIGLRSNSSPPSLVGYPLTPVHSTNNQLAPANQSANLGKGGSLSGGDWLGLHVSQQENFRSHQLPSAFQAGGSCDDSRTNTIFGEPSPSNTSVKESEISGYSARDLDRKSSSPLIRHTGLKSKPSLTKSPCLNRETPSPSLCHNDDLANPPSSKSPGLKVKKSNNVPDAAVSGHYTDRKKPSKSSAITGKKSSVSKNKQMACPSAVFHPSEEEFKDPVAYIKMIRREAERFGVCVIVPPESWKPEFRALDILRFNSECQLIHRLQDRWGPVENELACIKKHLEQQSIALVPMPQIGGCELDLPQFSKVVGQFGGLQKVIDNKKWTKIAETLKIPRAAQDRIGKLQDIYCKYLLSYDLLPQGEKADLLRQVQSEGKSKEQDTDSWSVKGRNLSLVPFQRLARNVQARFFKNPPSSNDVEREFWKIVHNRESYVCVHRGALDTNQEHSCFPTDKGDSYSKLGWNLNVLPHLPGSVLKHLGFVQDITIPWLQFDMLFSVNPWQTHPLAFYTVDYLHSGAEKIWYCVPAGEKKNLASVLEQEGNKAVGTSLADKLVSPSSLTDKGVEVTRVVQKQGQFVLVFPEAYHSSISCGYSVSEAVCFAPPDWLLLGSKRHKELQDPAFLNEFTYERLLVGLAEQLDDETQEVVQCLLEELKVIRDEEKSFMTELLELGLVDTVDKEKNSTGSIGRKGKKTATGWTQADSSCVLYCEECDKPCYLSAVIGENEPQVLCLKHAVKYIRAKASPEGFQILSRYDTGRLDDVVIKVEEKLKKIRDPTS